MHILTVDEKYATYQLRDDSLLQQVNPSIQVHTTKTREPFKAFTLLFGKKSMPKPAFSNETNASFIKKISRFIRGNFFIPDPRKGWKPYAVKKDTELIQQEKIHCVITAGPPHSTHFIGKELKEKLKVYWMVDFHDLWTDVIYYDMLYHLPMVKRLDKKLERTILEAGDLIITVGDRYKDKLLSKSNKIIPDKIKILRIGYDENLFDTRADDRVQERFIITYAGTIANFYEPEVFISALKSLVDKFPEVQFRLKFAGILSGDIKNSIIKAGLESILDELGYISHQQSIKLLKDSTVLLLVNPVTKDEQMVIPGKIYEYLAAGKPIVNITKRNSETALVIENCKAGKTFERSEQQALVDYLTALVKQWKMTGTLDIANNQALVNQYSRNVITNQLINLLPH
jgi:glycosyltransferase involved in cell wall biosynthesis